MNGWHIIKLSHFSATRIVLNQNTPNPFNDKTVISYFIPANATQAQILVYDNMGMLVKRFDIKAKGEGTVTFYPVNSRKGIYSYSLVVDGKVIDMKKMMIL